MDIPVRTPPSHSRNARLMHASIWSEISSGLEDVVHRERELTQDRVQGPLTGIPPGSLRQPCASALCTTPPNLVHTIPSGKNGADGTSNHSFDGITSTAFSRLFATDVGCHVTVARPRKPEKFGCRVFLYRKEEIFNLFAVWLDGKLRLHLASNCSLRAYHERDQIRPREFVISRVDSCLTHKHIRSGSTSSAQAGVAQPRAKHAFLNPGMQDSINSSQSMLTANTAPPHRQIACRWPYFRGVARLRLMNDAARRAPSRRVTISHRVIQYTMAHKIERYAAKIVASITVALVVTSATRLGTARTREP
ncbi:hypothetical protein AURDEDRAFT_125761 [Auricularia subglabra TFB-10046 SS5]|nr:hypothetical protein AURDEDRAFT_125761 [Auricularia subglabra TFB-10046 SS5]